MTACFASITNAATLIQEMDFGYRGSESTTKKKTNAMAKSSTGWDDASTQQELNALCVRNAKRDFNRFVNLRALSRENIRK